MHVLHITGSYGGTEVYKNLITHLDYLGVEQTVFVPLNYQNRERVGNQLIDFKNKGSRIIYSTSLGKRHKYLLGAKIKTVLKEIESNVDLKKFDIIHCANLCTDGAVAYEINKRYGIPYISAVRNTDLFTYYSLFFWKRKYFNDIAKSAQKVIFISHAHKKLFSDKYLSSIGSKIEIIPNGVADTFINNRHYHSDKLGPTINLIFASAYVQNKSLKELIQAVAELREETKWDVTITAVGDGLPFRKVDPKYIAEIYNLAKNFPWVKLEKHVPKAELLEMYRKSDIYVMPSKPETFGLVYVEAMSQGIPIIYGEGQGFDGYFDEGSVGYHAKAFDVSSIKEAIRKTVSNYPLIIESIKDCKLEEMFSWGPIAKKYYQIYRKCKENAKLL